MLRLIERGRALKNELTQKFQAGILVFIFFDWTSQATLARLNKHLREVQESGLVEHQRMKV